ncbi:hypothetical protein [Tabrizicola sp.]|jgi:hypothetical protein|uniref:hypothetical protein n=1 Tax=Tabrizicola sp. TaxID=2005166 RepID=UPI000BDB0AA9|nr:hypothetical protein [Tabrizicola sp.]MBY0349558.1 hypothetical protein [Tabrizicola sp.]OYX20670.1 MAG: hypothetical protein B7Z04_05385 [Rhodobacterales bacterium 32-66-9]
MSTPPFTFSRRSVTTVLLSGITLAALPAPLPAQGAADANTLTVDGMLAYLGVLPAAIVRGHPRSHPEAAMHGGVPDGRHQYHVILALFDAASGDRIETAQVALTIMGLGHTGGTRLDLEPMTIANTVTWGTFVELPGKDLYEMTFEVRTEGRKDAVVFPFRYAHSTP